MPRLLSIATLYPSRARPHFGTFVSHALDALAARPGWDVTVINPIGLPPVLAGEYRALADAAVDELDGEVAVHRPRFTLIPRIGGRFNPGLIAHAVLPLARQLHAEAPFDMVDAQFFYPDGPAAAAIAEELGRPLAIKGRGADIHYWGAKGFARAKMLRAARQASRLLAVSGALAEDMAALGMDRGKIAVHHTGLDRDRFRPLQNAGLRRMLGERLGVALPQKEPILASVGALIPRKGQDLVLRALADLPDAKLLLVGHGPDDAMLRGLAEELGIAGRVHFLGSVDHDLLPLILSAADIMVLPSRSEGLANAWIEALACGTPIVIADVGGARDVVRGAEAGLIVARDPAAIAEGVRTILAHPPQPRDTAALVAEFGWASHAEALDAIYSEMVETDPLPRSC
ncbi:glycosyltransferase [Alteriqipengyuania lutimaris]|uniref:Glycosyltransferase family 4 protein n=1 Tax=Alteriqipengyuania lutimaris TaxID=1538146 RepID=A0A395LMS0_9SPHN|nr:glycosyltransferase [Alteriqipengyuania lutimaris]MBB3032534.1 glycosyltransferase involved in cell wall biosynthesis [Alteriqipengyuania lutimaris]RDS78333.1 glycosyltransferase family 4 protein [Alteriqipengyuania lutimaris]